MIRLQSFSLHHASSVSSDFASCKRRRVQARLHCRSVGMPDFRRLPVYVGEDRSRSHNRKGATVGNRVWRLAICAPKMSSYPSRSFSPNRSTVASTAPPAPTTTPHTSPFATWQIPYFQPHPNQKSTQPKHPPSPPPLRKHEGHILCENILPILRNGRARC